MSLVCVRCAARGARCVGAKCDVLSSLAANGGKSAAAAAAAAAAVRCARH